MDAHAERPRLEVTFPDDEHGVDLGLLGAQDLAVDFVGGCVHLGSDAVTA